MVRIISLALLISVLGCGALHAADPRPVVFGSLSADPADEMKDWLPFVKYLGGALAGDGISEGKLIVARDVTEMAAHLKSGRVDIYIDSPIVMYSVMNESGAKLLARRWKGRSPDYSSVIVVRQDSGIVSLSGLKDKVIAFQKESSSTGYLLPRALITLAGLSLQQVTGVADMPPAGQVGYRFSLADRNTLAWVFHGRVAAGATSNEDFDKFDETQRAQLMVIVETEKIPRQVVAHRGDLPPALVMRIKAALLAMDQTADGKKALALFDRTEKFDEIPEAELVSLARYEAALRRAGLIK